jgi:hypothetical protein
MVLQLCLRPPYLVFIGDILSYRYNFGQSGLGVVIFEMFNIPQMRESSSIHYF